METLDTLARHDGPRGEVVLRRRSVGPARDVDELIVNGAFAMDSTETCTERTLAELAVAGVPAPRGCWSAGSASATPWTSCWSPTSSTLDVVEIEDVPGRLGARRAHPDPGRGGR